MRHPTSPSQDSRLTYVSLGSNVGRRVRQLALACMRLALLDGVELLRLSSVFETAPWGVTDQPPFANMVLAARIALTPEALLRAVKRLELQLGRRARERWGPREIDIDVLLMDGVSLDSPELAIPHPRILERQFVLAPLAEIAPWVELAPGVRAAELVEAGSDEVTAIGQLAQALADERRASP